MNFASESSIMSYINFIYINFNQVLLGLLTQCNTPSEAHCVMQRVHAMQCSQLGLQNLMCTLERVSSRGKSDNPSLVYCKGSELLVQVFTQGSGPWHSESCGMPFDHLVFQIWSFKTCWAGWREGSCCMTIKIV